ncbi:MAG: trimethylamine methyltransferase family protein [Desulfomonilaceae bacterium]|nr:trimethylamine methyltransferase family protein [Desulfomonilaceae bacterium]
MGITSQFYRPPTAEHIKAVDLTGRRILGESGIRITDRSCLDELRRAGAAVDYDSERVRFPGDWLDDILQTAPRRFVLYSRDGRNDVHLGEGKVHFTNGGRVFQILNMATGGSRRTMLRDVARTAALVDRLDNIRFYIIACQAHDIDAENYHLNDFYNSFNHTTKHVMGGCDHVHGAEQMWKLASIVAGGEEKFRERPFASVITNPISPLTIESTTLSILRFCSTHGIPVTCAPAPIAGATAPATLAGTLAQMHAEALAGVALTQVFQPGAKVLYGAVPSAMDLRTMSFTMGSVETALMNAFAVHLAKLYDLPIYASGGTTESKRPDIQSGVEKMFSSLLVAMAGGDCIHLAAGMLDSCNSISYEQYVIDNEVIGMIHRVLAGIEVNEETLAFDVVNKVGPGGNYVIEDHTIEHMMDEYFYPVLAVRSNFDIWEGRGRPDMLTRAHDMVERILEENSDGLLDRTVIAAITEAFPGLRNG